MPLTGAIGIHVEANSSGYSRDIAVANARQIGGKYATVVNDPLLCLMLLDVGVTPIHRINRGGLLDDNQQQYGNTREYIRTAHTEVPDKRALLNWNNEPAHDTQRLLREGLVAIDEAVKLGRTLVMLGWSYGNPEPADHDILDPLYRRMAETGMIYACHEGTDEQHPTLANCYPSLIGRFLPIQRKYGLQVIVTEFAASKDAWNGWQTWNSNYAAVCEDTVREVYAPNGVYMTPFTAFPWKTGFDYVNSPELKAAWKATNERYPVKEQPPVTQPTVPPPEVGGIKGVIAAYPPGIVYRNIRSQPVTSATDVGDLRADEVIVAYVDALDNGWCYIERLSDGVKGWVLWTGVKFAPELLPPEPPPNVTLTPAQVAQLRAHAKDIDAANAGIMAILDAAEGVKPPVSGGTF